MLLTMTLFLAFFVELDFAVVVEGVTAVVHVIVVAVNLKSFKILINMVCK